MIPENIEEKAKELKDSIIDSIMKFQSETSKTPHVEVSIIEHYSKCGVETTVDVKVKIGL